MMTSHKIVVMNFYKFIPLNHLEPLQNKLQERAEELQMRGSILLSVEGINANLGGSEEALDTFLGELQLDPRFADIRGKKSWGDTIPFSKLRVKIKKHILVFDEHNHFTIDEINQGKRMTPAEWKSHLDHRRDDVVLLDTRNNYEYVYGAFEGAEHLDIEHFSDFSSEFLKRYGDQKDKTFLVYCTGGIRCEKVTAFAHKHGFEHCYQLEGGIVSYFEQVGSDHWQGSCFVFDFRWAINPNRYESGEAHYLEDGFKGSVHTVPQKAIQQIGTWPPQSAEA